MKKLYIFLICLLIFVQPISAQVDTYYLYDHGSDGKLIANFISRKEAIDFYNKSKDKYDNLVLYLNDKVLLMEYGIAELKVNETCDYLVVIKGDGKRKVNACNAIDAAYISSNADLSEAKIMLSGFEGNVSMNDINLKPISKISNRPSMYYVKEGVLYHSIKTQFKIDYYTKNLALSETGIKDGAYYSYDGQYFYTDFKMMIDDYRNNTREHAFNFERPYYNYYMYLPFRSLSTYDIVDLKNYFNDNLMINRRLQDFNDLDGDGANDIINESELYAVLDEFVTYQYLYGNNVLLSLAMSIEESHFGKSLEVFEKNNLFGEYAFNGEYERNHHKYRKPESSIYAHMRFIMSDRYLNMDEDEYTGGYLGNLYSGINVNYSKDPYWGEKVAANAYQIDRNLGLQDLHASELGFSKKPVKLYTDQALSNYYKTSDSKLNVFNIIGDDEKTYKVLIDKPTNDETMVYDYANQVAYIAKDSLDSVKGQYAKPRYKNVIYDANGGNYYAGSKLELKVPFTHKIPSPKPTKDGYHFTGYVSVFTKDSYLLKAEYKKIESLKLNKPATQIINYGDNIDLKPYSLVLTFDDGSNLKIPVLYEMLDGYDKYKSGTQTVTLTYAGMKEVFEVKVSEDLSESRKIIDDEVNAIIDNYNHTHEFNLTELMHKLYKLRKNEVKIDVNRLRELDKMMMDYYDDRITISIDENPFDASITGLAFMAGSLEYYDFDLAIFSNAYRMSFENVAIDHISKIKKMIANYNFEYETSLKILFHKNYDVIQANFPFTAQIKLDNIDSNRLHTVYRLDPNGDIVKCKTSQSSNYIRFLSDKPGEFFVLSMDTNNNYDFKDKYEVLNRENTDYFAQKATLDILNTVCIAIVDEILIMVYLKIRERNKKVWRDYKKSLRNAELLQDEKPKN